MSVLSPQSIADVAHNAGFTGSALHTAVAIALAESGGNTAATHKNTNGSTDYGLWQINSIHADILRNGSWSNPQDNAIMAHTVYENAGNKFTPWSTYTSGRYLAYVGRAASVSASGSPLPSNALQGSASAVPVGLPIPNPVSALQGITDFAGAILNPHTWIRVALFIAGMALLWIAFENMTHLPSKVLKNAPKIAEVAAMAA